MYGDIIVSESDSGTTNISDLTDIGFGTEVDDYQEDSLVTAHFEVHRRNGVYTVFASNCGSMLNKGENKPFSFTVVKRTHKEREEQAANEAAD